MPSGASDWLSAVEFPSPDSLTQMLYQRAGNLVRTGSRLHTAVNAFQTGYSLSDVHSFYEPADSLQISVAAAGKTDIMEFTVYNIKINFPGTDAACFVCSIVPEMRKLIKRILPVGKMKKVMQDA